jgi:alanine dehydrogenase
MTLSNIFIPLIEKISEQGGVMGITTRDMGFRSGLYIYAGKLVNNYVAKYFNLPAGDISLFLTAF